MDNENLKKDTARLNLQESILNSHIKRLMEESCNPVSGVIFTDMSTDLERCSDQGINIATALKS